MSALIARLPEEKRTRLKLLAKARQVSATKLIEEMATVLLADFDAETRFALRAARGRGQLARGKAFLKRLAESAHARKKCGWLMTPFQTRTCETDCCCGADSWERHL